MLKWIALIIMTIDHIGYYFYPFLPEPAYLSLRMIGRLAFPVFAFYIVKGFARTSDRFKYLMRMSIWAVIAHIAISCASVFAGRQDTILDFSWTNILVLFTFAIIMLMGYDLAMRSYHDMVASMTLVSNPPMKIKNTRYDVKVNLGGINMSPRAGIALGIVFILLSFWAVNVLNADYGIYGLLTILLIHISYDPQDDRTCLPILAASLVLLNTGYITLAAVAGDNIRFALIQSLSILAIFSFNLTLSSGKKPSLLSKYFFYVYYPLHISILILLSSYWEEIRTLLLA